MSRINIPASLKANDLIRAGTEVQVTIARMNMLVRNRPGPKRKNESEENEKKKKKRRKGKRRNNPQNTNPPSVNMVNTESSLKLICLPRIKSSEPGW